MNNEQKKAELLAMDILLEALIEDLSGNDPQVKREMYAKQHEAFLIHHALEKHRLN